MSRADSTWVDKSWWRWERQTLKNSKEKIANGQLTISSHVNETNNNFDFQPNQFKSNSKPSANWSLTYYLSTAFEVYITDFPVIINSPQLSIAMICAKLCRR